jgi:hypothetical protein
MKNLINFKFLLKTFSVLLIPIILGLNKQAFGQKKITNDIFLNLLSKTDSDFINAKRLYLVKETSNFFSVKYITNVLDTIDVDTLLYERFQKRIDSINSKKETWKYKNRKLKIYPNGKKTDRVLIQQHKVKNNQKQYVKFIRLGLSPTLYWNNLYLISYWMEYGGLSRRGKIAILKLNNDNEFEILKIVKLTGAG